MKYLIKYFVLASCLLFAQCGGNEDVERFSIYHSLDFTINAGSNTLDTHFFRFLPVFSFYKDQLAANNIAEDDINRVDPKSCEFGSVFSDIDLDFIHEISIQIFATNDPTNRREIFFLDPVPLNAGKNLNPFPALPDIKDFVSADNFGIEVLLRYRYIPTENIPMRLEMLFAARD